MAPCAYGVLPKSPYSTCYRTPRCHLMAPNWKSDPHREYFCKRWGSLAGEICPEMDDPCESTHIPMQGLDHFSWPPMYRRSMCEPKFRYHRATFEPDPCAGSCRLSCSCCPGIPQLPFCYRPNPKPYGDAVCGLCVNNDYGPRPKRPSNCGVRPINDDDDIGDEEITKACEMPFMVLPLFSPIVNKKTRKISEAERCLHPSDMRYLDSNYKLDFEDFFKTQTRENIDLYRGHLAIDNRRPGPKVPKPTSDLALPTGQPIYVNARAIKMKPRGKPERKSYSVCIPGPITIGI